MGDEDMEWDIAHKNIMSKSGKQVKKRCMNLFGRQLCLCQFLDFIDAQSADHLCYPVKSKMAKKAQASKKYQKLLKQEKKKEHELAKMNKELKHDLSKEHKQTTAQLKS